ncbi:MAG: hypothetical protein WC850_01660 [Candidatus Gracilibacteria bacterium]
MHTIPTCEGNKIIVEADGRTSLKITPPEGIKEQEKKIKNNIDNILK